MAYILLIEPNRVLAQIYADALEQQGHEVCISSRADTAVSECDQQCPDVIVLELQLVEHNGIEFLYEFRSYPEWNNVPVVLLTLAPPTTLNLTVATMKQLNIAGYLYKPSADLRKLLKLVDLALQPAKV
jgi:DNA-binding response OmpR family regulator